MSKAAELACLLVYLYIANVVTALGSDDNKYDGLLKKFHVTEEENQCKIEALNAKIADLSEKMEAMNSELSRLRHGASCQGTSQIQTQPKIAFYAVVSKHFIDGLDPGEKVVFDIAYTNIGSAYQPATGMFVAPIDGTYAFSVVISGRKADGSTSYYVVNVNNALRGKLISHTLQQDSQFLVLTLVAGDYVYVTTVVAKNGLLGSNYSSFSGFLLYQN